MSVCEIPEDGNRYLYDAAIDTDAWLAATLGEPIELSDAVEGGWDNEPLVRAACEDHSITVVDPREFVEYITAARDNVYNAENDFGTVFTFTVYAPHTTGGDWCWDDNCYVAVCEHLGGDVRGNYGGVTLYRPDAALADCGFLDWTLSWGVERAVRRLDSRNRVAVVDWEHDENMSERAAQGYSSCPSAELVSMIGHEDGEWRGGAFYFEPARNGSMADNGGLYRATPHSYAGQY